MLFKLRGELSKKVALSIEIIGFFVLLLIWSLITGLELIPSSMLPSPFKVITSFGELHNENALIRNLAFSIKINILGYLEAIAISIPLGFVIGLFPVCREMFKRPIDAARFLPLTALTGLFIAWFGIDTSMKVQFLSFGIIVYLVPVVIQRIYEVENVFCDTVYTLGATSWQTIRYVFIPAVCSKVFDDIRILVAISWTYIIAAELVNKSDGGIGALAYTCARQSRVDKVFAILLVIILVGFLQDKFAGYLDKMFFPHKYTKAS